MTAPDWDPDGEPDGPGSGDDRYGPHPSPEVCAFCRDVECDGVACIARLDPDDPDDLAEVERLQALLRAGGHDCGHRCCNDRHNPLHDHFLSPDECAQCQPEPERVHEHTWCPDLTGEYCIGCGVGKWVRR